MAMNPRFATTFPGGGHPPQVMPQQSFPYSGRDQQQRGDSRQPPNPPHPRPDIIPDELLRTERVDLRNETLTEDDYFNLLSQYYPVRIEKVEPREKLDVNGNKIKPTWANCTRYPLPKHDFATVLNQVRLLNLQDRDPKKGRWPTILKKQSSLGPNAQRQIAKAHQDLSSEIRDNRFHIVLDQIDWTEKSFESKDGKAKRRSSNTRHGSHGKARTKERTSILAYFKSCPRPEHVPSELYLQLQREEVERQARRVQQHPYAQRAPGQQAYPPQQAQQGLFHGVQPNRGPQEPPQQQPHQQQQQQQRQQQQRQQQQQQQQQQQKSQVNVPHPQQQQHHPQNAAGVLPNRPQPQGGPPVGPAMHPPGAFGHIQSNQGPPRSQPVVLQPNQARPVQQGAFQHRQPNQGPPMPPAGAPGQVPPTQGRPMPPPGAMGQMPPNQGQQGRVPDSHRTSPSPHGPSRPNAQIIIEHDNRGRRRRGSSTASSSGSSRARSTFYSDSESSFTVPSSVDTGSPPMAYSGPVYPKKPQGPGPNSAAAVPLAFPKSFQPPRISTREHSRDNIRKPKTYIITGDNNPVRVPQQGPPHAHSSRPEDVVHMRDEVMFQAGVSTGRARQREEDRFQRQQDDHAARRHAPARSPSRHRFKPRSTPRTEVHNERDHGFRHVGTSAINRQRSREQTMIDDFDTMHLGGDGGGRRGRAFSRHDDRDDVNFYRAKQQHENHLARRARDEQEDIMRQQERMRLRDELTSPRNPFMRNTLRSRFTFGGDPAFDY